MEGEPSYPVSLAQESMWFLQALAGDNDVYNETGALAFSGPFRPDLLLTALELVLTLHPGFTTTFHLVAGKPCIRLRRPATDELMEQADLSQLAGPQQEQAREAAIDAFAHRPFDLARGPLARFLLLRLAPEEHLLVGCVHHIIADRITQQVLLTAVVGLYLAQVEGEDPGIEPPSQEWLEENLRTRVQAERDRVETSFPQAAEYWREAVPADLAELRLPWDRSRPATRSGAGDYLPFTLDATTRSAVAELAKQLGVTKFIVLLSVYSLLLHRYADCAAVPIQVAMNTRTPQQAQDVGLFVNSLPVVTQVDPAGTVADHIRAVDAAMQATFTYRSFPFSRVMQLVALDRAGVNPLTQCSMTYSKHMAFDATFGPLRIQYLHVQRSGAKGDLALEVLDHGNRFDCGFNYSTELFDAATISRVAGHFQNLLANALAAPDRAVRDLEMVSAAERDAVLTGFGRRTAGYDDDVTLARLFTRQVARTPAAQALRFEGQSLTYAELDEAATRLGHVLVDLGVGPDQPVAICLERSLEVVIAILAVHKAGGAYVPLDPEDPGERRAFTITDTGAAVLLTFRRHLPGLTTDAQVLCLDEGTWREAPATPLPERASSRNLAYVIFTSGSTGQPKGVEIEHHSVVNLLTWRQDEFPINSGDRLLHKTPYTFDPSVWQYFWPLINGATLVLAAPDGHRDLNYLARLVDSEAITVTQFVPSMLTEFAAATPTGGGASLRQVYVGGEALTREQASTFFDHFPDCQLINTYGPAECTVESTYCVEVPGTTGNPTIGRPIANSAIYVLDANLAPCPIGVAGQLCVAGPLVGRGYRNRPERTAAAFLPNPYDDSPDWDRIYLTGDRARWLPNGELDFLGRDDDQVKIRGHRVELAEVEAQVRELPGVIDCAVIAGKDAAGATMIVAYLVGSHLPRPRELRSLLAGRLPSYMVPAALMTVPALPRTRHDKLDVRALPAPDFADLLGGAEHVQPRNATEETLAEIWADVLGVSGVGIDDDFFALGGHSLLATRLVTRVAAALDTQVEVRTIFEHPTIRGFAEALQLTQPGLVAPQIVPVERVEPLPLSHAQQRLWFLDQFEPGNPAYNVPGALDVTGAVDIDRLRTAVNRVVERNESLRTTFPSSAGQPRALVADRLHVEVQLHERDAAGTTPLLVELSRAPFDLAAGPLLRVDVIRRGPTDHTLVVVMHHIISDAWSLQAFINELRAAYAGEDLPDLAVQYVDFAVWQRAWLSGPVLERQLDHWRSVLADAPRLELPTDRPRPATPSYRGQSLMVRLDDELETALHGLAHDVDATMYVTMLGLVGIALAKTANCDDLTLGSVIAGRNHPGIESIIGFFVNTLALRIDLAGDPTFAEVVDRLRTTTLDAAANQDVPFDRVVDAVAPQRDTSRQALFDVMYVHQNRPELIVLPDGITGRRAPIPVTTAKFDLTVTTTESRKGFFIELEWATDLFDRATIERFAEHLQMLVAQVAADPSRRLSQLTLLTEAERADIVAWNDTAAPYPHASLVELLEQCAQEHAQQVAVVFDGDGSTLTFAELDARAEALAAALRARGVGVRVPVALYLHRCLEMVVAIVAVLKSGGAYVPISPELPADRVTTILADTRAPVLVTAGALAAPAAPGVSVIRADALPPVPAASEPAEKPGPDDLAYILYTSGSTGLPKGALIAHRGIVNLIHWHQQRYRMGADEVVLLKTPYDHDISVTELFIPLLLGSRLVVAVPDGHRDPDYLADVVRRHGVTVLHFVPTMLNEFVAAPATAQCESLAHVFCGGEALRHELVGAFAEALPGVALHNMYGPTETTDYTTCWEADPGDAAAIAPIGRPITNMRAYVVDLWGSLVPVGTPGELWVAGAGMGHGYLRRPELNATAFTANPFDTDFDRVYHSGDVCRWRADGVLEFVRRADGQVKIRGHRVETGEVEAVLAAHPDVNLAAAVLREDTPGVHRLIAYVAGDPDVLTGTTLRAWCAARLPEFAVPSLFLVLPGLPKLPNGKIDRRALPAPVAGRADSDTPYEAPATATQRVLAAIWADVLGVAQVGAGDSFFALGGDSILSIRMVARAREAGLRLSVRSVFQFDTLAALAAHIDAAPDEVVAAEQGRILGAYQLTPIQRWFLAQDLPTPSHFTQSLAIPLPAGDAAPALAAVAEHHDVFRVRFAAGAAAATDLPAAELWPLVTLPERSRGEDSSAAVAELAARLDIEHGPTALATVVDDRLLLVVHHLIVDGVSWRILVEDLATAMRGAALPTKTTSYQAWGQRLHRAAGDPALRQEVPYWREQLSAPAAITHTGRNTEADARTVEVVLDPARTAALLTSAHAAYRTRVDDLLLAALHRAVGVGRLGVDLESHGRSDRFPDMDLTRTVGWFTSLFPVALTAPVGADVGATVVAVKEALRAVPDRGVGYGILRWLAGVPELDAPTHPIALNYLGQIGDAQYELGGSGDHAPDQPRAHVLDINAAVSRDGASGDQLHIAFTAPTDAAELAGRYLAELCAVIDHCVSARPTWTPSDFPLAAGLSASALAALDPGDVADVYPLTPLQQGMVFHSQLDPNGGAYVEQLAFSLHTSDPAAFEALWCATLNSYDTFRTEVASAGLETPLAVVRTTSWQPVETLDWAGTPPQQQGELLADFLAADRQRGLDLARAPLWRLTRIGMGAGRYRYVWTFHHVLLDGWSYARVLGAVMQAHAGEPAARPTTEVRDHAVWAARQDREVALSHWAATLAGFTAPTRLSLPAPDATSAGQRTLTTHITGPAAQALQAFCRRTRCTTNTLVQGAWSLLLSRYTGHDDVLFGATTSGRPADLPGADEIIGCLINTIPARVRVPAEAQVGPWLAEIQQAAVADRTYDFVGITDIQAVSEVPADDPLFATILVFENFPVDAIAGLDTAGLGISDVVMTEQVNYPLAVVCAPTSAGGVEIRLQYDRTVYPDWAMTTMLDHLARLVSGLSADPQRRLSQIVMLSAAELAQLRQWAAPQVVAPPASATIPELVGRWVADTPDAPAVATDTGTLSYAELDSAADLLAHRLIATGVTPGSRVGVCLDRDANLIVSLLAILKAGAAYVPLDPDDPDERVAFMVADTSAAAVVTSSALAGRFAPGVTLIELDAHAGTRQPMPGDPPNVPIHLDDVAYCLYTSGSTGTPKGVQVTHRGVAQLLADPAWVDLGPGRPVMFVSPLAFDASTFDIWAPLINGATCVVYPDRVPTLAGLRERIATHQVDTLILTTKLFNTVIDEDPGMLDGVGQVLTGGEAASPRHWAAAVAALPNTRVMNVYGPTEATVIASTWSAPADFTAGDRVPIGRPMAANRAYVLGPDLSPVPVGAPGELCLGGPGIARGYLNRDELNARVFLTDPFQPGGRMYRTGDIVRWLPDGTLEYSGRSDDQVKIRGHRIELGEVAAAIEACPGVRDVIVLARRNDAGEITLVAYVERASDLASDLNPSRLREWSEAALPDFMWPTAFVVMAEFPVNQHRKVDRRALPEPDLAAQVGTAYQAPRTPTEEILAEVWAEILRRPAVGIDDDFFALGGHSLLATRLVSRIKTLFDRELPIRAVFEHPTVAALAAELTLADRPAAPPLTPADRGAPLPLSYAQERLWFLDQWSPGDPTYNIPAAVRLSGALDPEALQQAVDALAARHESLRTTFPTVDGRPLQAVAPTASIPMRRIVAADSAQLQEIIGAETSWHFDLAAGPLVRVALVEQGPDEHVLIITMHHVISDGWSMAVLVDELGALYRAAQEGGDGLAPLPVQYPDFAVWQRNWLRGGELDRQTAYWTEQLSGRANLDLPTDSPRPAEPSHAGALLTRTLDPDATSRLLGLARADGATEFMALLAVVEAALGRSANTDDFVIGTIIAGRNTPGIEGLIGFFVNTLALPVDLSGDPTFTELLHRVRATALGAYANQDVPFEVLVDQLGTVRDPSRHPLFQVAYTHENTPALAGHLAGMTLTPLPVGRTSAKFDLNLTTRVRDGRIEIEAEYATDLFLEATVAALLNRVERVLAAVADGPGRRLSELPVLTAQEQWQLTVGWNQTARAHPGWDGQTVASLFAAQCRRTPTAAAVTADGTGVTLTYEELEARATALAATLRGMGVGPDVVVGVCLDRHEDLVVALMGILFAGGAYVPVDPGEPASRQAFTLDDAGARAVVTHRVHAGALPDTPIVCLDEPLEPGAGVGPAAGPEHLAYVLYTSGSTGQPKGVQIEHQSIVNLLAWRQDAYPMGPGDTLFHKTPITFDPSVWQFLQPLLTGARLLLATPDGHRDPAYQVAAMARHHVTHTQYVPTLLDELLTTPGLDQCTALRHVSVGGEALSTTTATAFVAALPGVLLVNTYGPAECTIETTACEVTAANAGTTSIGRPLDNVAVHVLDDHLQLVPVGVPGELCIAGIGVMRGYLNRPDATDAAFATFGGQRIYRTGDLARWLPSGELDFLGRRDGQVKIRGHRVETGEVAAVLAGAPGVAECAVIVRTDPGGARLVAYIVPADGLDPDTSELRRYGADRLPDYMVPAAFVALAALPTTKHGKLDVKALPAPARTITAGKVAPRTPTERLLAQVWADVLGVDSVGVNDNFFELGGDSIRSIRIVHRAVQAGLDLSVQAIFNHQTIAELATHVRWSTREIAAEQGQVSGDVPLTPIQRWFFDRALPDPGWYDQSLLFTLPGDVPAADLQAALTAVAEHHDALRTRFTPGADGAFVASVAEVPGPQLWPLQVFPDGTDVVAATTTLMSSFDLAAGPMLAAGLFEGPSRRLFLAAHHLVVDTVSWRILLEDLQDVLAGRPLPAKTTSFQHWARRLRDYDPGPAELEYWRAVAATAPTQLPLAPQAAANLEADMASVAVTLPAQTTQALLTDAAAAYHTQVNDLLLAALQQVVSQWADTSSVRIDLEGHGREELFADCDLSRTVGWFTSVFPVELDAPHGCDPATRIKTVKETLRAVPRHGIGFAILTGTHPELAGAATIGFNYLGQVDRGGSPDGDGPTLDTATEIGPERAPSQPRDHEIDITAAVIAGQLRVTVMGPGRRIDAAGLSRLGQGYLDALSGLVAHCLSVKQHAWTPSDFPLADLTQAQVDRIALAEPDLGDVWTLTPVQHGMLYHTLVDPSGGDYVEQLAFTVQTADPAGFESAWLATLGRHGLFRARAFWDGLDAPVLAVRRTPAQPLATLDWTRVPDQEQRLATWLLADRARGFDLDQPLWRLTRITLEPQRYRYVWTFHHLLMDGWSNANLFAELSATYAEQCLGSGVPAPTGPEFAEYVAWLRAQDPEAAAEFWRATLGGFESATTLQLPRPTGPAGHRQVRETLARGRLEAGARAARVTLNTLVQGAWAYVLHRYADTSDVTFGVTSSGRPESLPSAGEIIGCLLNTVPLRVAIDPQQPVADFLAAIQDREISARQYDFVSLPAINRAAGLAPDTELFTSILVFENAPLGQVPQLPGIRVSDVAAAEQTNYPLTVVATPDDATEQPALLVDLIYDAVAYDDDAMARLGRHLRRVITAMAAHPELPLGQVPLLGAAELEQFDVWNATAVDFDDERSFAELVADVAQRSPDAIAVVCDADGTTLTYAQLLARADGLARRLLDCGVGANNIVALCVDRSPEMVIGILGVARAGAAWTPIDPEYPAARREFILADTAARVAVTVSGYRDLVAGTPTVLCLDEPADSAPLPSLSVGLAVPDPEALAHVIYTSGSTGRPKGVMVTNANLANFLAWQGAGFAAVTGDRVLVTTPFTFDALSDSLHVGLICGATCVLARPGAQRDPEQIADVIARRRITTCGFVPSQVSGLLEQPAAADLTSLQTLIVGGEALTATVVAATARTWPGVALVNLYGPTEATNTSTAWLCDPADPDDPPIGRPIANMKAFLLDAQLRPVPLGAPGELCMAGAGVTHGYLGLPERTAQAFVPNPFGAGMMYRTGDRCRQRPDGVFEYLGRADGQVKLRGNRIELGEIAGALLAHPEVADAAVIVREDRPGDQRLVGYVVSDTQDDLRAWCAQRLPAYAVPSAVVAIDALPHTQHGKLDSRALPAPELGRRLGHQAVTPPETPTEITIAQIWAEVLGVPEVGADQGFYELGGHSLLAARVVSRMNLALGLDLPVRTVLTNPTVRSLAALADSGGAARDSYLVTLQDGPAGSPLILFPAGGDLVSYRAMAQRVAGQRPVWGLLGAGWERSGQVPTSLADLVDRYVAEIRAAQRRGPYLLGGWSMGGVLALEAGRQLRADGAEVVLYLLDTYADSGFRDEQALTDWLALLRALSGGSDAFDTIRRANAGLLVGYTPQPYEGRLELFTSADGEPPERRAAQLGNWRQVAPDLHNHVVPGDHESMLATPNVDVLAQELHYSMAGSRDA